jgi:hypothetical protein
MLTGEISLGEIASDAADAVEATAVRRSTTTAAHILTRHGISLCG